MLKIRRLIPPQELRLFIFDLDGTLVDSRLDLANSINAMLRHFDRAELPCEVIANYIGDGAPMLVRRSLGDPDDEQFFKEAMQFFLDWYREHKLDNTYVYPGTFEALDRLRATANGVARKMAVLSNKPVHPSRAIVEALGLGKYFFQVYGGNSFHTKKPDPFGALKLAEEAGVHPEQTVVIGDSHNDVLTARNAGMWSLGLTYGLAPQSLVMTPPDMLVDSPEEIPQAFEPEAESRAREQNGDVEPPSPS
jgi:phosphoglycolate phosphatase